jgi:DNA repair protein RadC
VATRLLARHGSLAELLDWPTDALLVEFPDLVPAIEDLVQFRKSMGNALRSRLVKMPVLSQMKLVVDYLRTTQKSDPVEALRGLFLTSNLELLADEVLAQGTHDRLTVYPREVARHGLRLGAGAVILVHNHPNGDSKPSDDDVETTNAIVRACAAIDFQVIDHIILGRDEWTSFRFSGLMS